MECNACKDLKQQDYWGCGKPGKMTYKYQNAIEPYNKICPRWYAKQPFVNGIYSDLNHYKNGSLGNVKESISAAHLEYIEILDAAIKEKNIDNFNQGKK